MPGKHGAVYEESSSVRRAEQPPEPSERDPRALYYTEDSPVRSKAMLDEISKGNEPAHEVLLESAQQGEISRSVQRFIQRTAAPATAAATPDASSSESVAEAGTGQEAEASNAPASLEETSPAPEVPSPASGIEANSSQAPEVSTAITQQFEMLPDPAAPGASTSTTPAEPQSDLATALELNTQLKVQALQRTQEVLTPERMSEVLSNVRLGPAPQDPPGMTPSPNETLEEEDESGGGGSGAPKGEVASDVIDAIVVSPKIIDAVENLKNQAEEQIGSYWEQLVSGERSTVISAGVVVGIPTFAGLADLSNLNGQVLPVPGADWLKIEVSVDPEGNDLMLGLHVDLSLLLPDSLGQKGAGKPRTPSAAPAEPPPGDNTDKSDKDDKDK